MRFAGVIAAILSELLVLQTFFGYSQAVLQRFLKENVQYSEKSFPSTIYLSCEETICICKIYTYTLPNPEYIWDTVYLCYCKFRLVTPHGGGLGDKNF